MNKLLLKSLLILCIATSFVCQAQSDVYKCSNKDGSILYTDSNKGKRCNVIKRLEPEIGMSPDQVKSILSDPARITFVKSRSGKTEQWTYPDGLVLKFKDNVLETIEQK